jgi:hypothetical protein
MQLVDALRYKAEGSGFDPWWWFGRTMALGLTASNRNKYQEYFVGVKAAGA